MKQFDCFVLDTANQCLLRAGTPVELPPKPFAVLRYLVEHPGRLITHDELLDALWAETYVQPQVLRTYVLELRKVLGDEAAHPRFIQTLPKRGFRFVAEVTEQSETLSKNGLSPYDLERPGPCERPPTLVGRDRELASLHQQVRQLAAGQRRTVFVTGEAGIGKTALVDAFCRQQDLAAVNIARGQCVQGIGSREVYYPMTEALCQLCAGADGEAVCRILARMAPAWLGNASPQQDHEDGGSSTAQGGSAQRTVADLCGALEALAAAKPLILIFEDLQWADESTLHLISALARRRAQAQLMILATVCPQPGGGANPVSALSQDLRLRRLSVELELSPLSKAGVGELLRTELGQQTLPRGLVDFVSRRSEGNPLFVIALLEHLISQGNLARPGDAGKQEDWPQSSSWPEIEAGMPDQLARMIEMEIERLPDPAQQLLEAASLLEVAFPAWAVAAALGKDAVEVEEECDALARHLHFVVRAGHDELPDGSTSAFYAFAHGLYREVLYHRQAPARRARRHVRIAERLSVLFAGRESDVAREIAMHYEAAGQTEQAANVLRMAASKAGVC